MEQNKVNNLLRLKLKEEIMNKVKNLSNLKEKILSGENINVIVFHHYDLDGYGIKILFKLLERKYKNLKVDYKEIKTSINSKNIDFNTCIYDYVLIGDLSFESTSDIWCTLLSSRLILLDHHSSENALELNKYDWAFVKPHNIKEFKLITGTSLWFEAMSDLLINDNDEHYESKLYAFVNSVAAYDTYFFKEKEEVSNEIFSILPFALNCLFKFEDEKDNFCNNILRNILKKETFSLLNSKDIEKVHIIERIIKSEIKKANEEFVVKTVSKYVDDEVFEYTAGVYFYSGEYGSEIGNALCDMNNIDFALLINMNTSKCQLRTIRDDLDLTKTVIKGIPVSGGHPKACGFSFHNEQIKDIINIIEEYN